MRKLYAISDLHGCIEALEEALLLFEDALEKDENTGLIVLGDLCHGGSDNRSVLDRLISLQNKYGKDRIIVLAGNHEVWIADGLASIDHEIDLDDEDRTEEDDQYINWFSSLPLYHVEGNTIFVHAGIDEKYGALWEWSTDLETFTMKFPAETGKIEGLDMKVVAGHVGTSTISGNPDFHGIFYDGASHYYIDSTVLESGKLNVLLVDTETDRYFRVTERGPCLILPYDEENH